MPSLPNKNPSFSFSECFAIHLSWASFDRHDKLFILKTLFKDSKEIWFVNPSRLLIQTGALKNICLQLSLKGFWVSLLSWESTCRDQQALKKLWTLETGKGALNEKSRGLDTPPLRRCVDLPSAFLSIKQRPPADYPPGVGRRRKYTPKLSGNSKPHKCELIR